MVSWFKSGGIIANSEEALSIYSPLKTAESNITVWYPTGMGGLTPFGLNRAYVFLIPAQLADWGVPAYVNQAFLISTTMLLTLLSSYILFNYFSRGSFLISLFGSFFYLLNLYTQAQIFRRLLYNFMFALAYYPLFLYLLIRVLESGSLKFILLFTLSSVIFSFSFNQPATLFPFFISAVVVFLVKFWRERKSPKKIITLIFISFITLILWISANFWWIYPITKGSGDYISTTTNTDDLNFQSLQAVSQSFPLSQILLLRQAWWYGQGQHWYEFYKNPFIYLLSFIVLVIVVIGLIKSRTIPYRNHLLWLLGIGLFICKGTNIPLGYTFFHWLFYHFFLSQALRNPYEKFGIVFLLPYAFFFGYGIRYLSNRLKNTTKNLFLAGSFLLFMVILVWPTWVGNVFFKEELIKVPNYYMQANSLLNKQSELRIFHVPLSSNFNERYNWGYYGQDPAENLFDRDPLSNTLTPLMNKIFYKNIPEIAKHEDFPKLLGFLGAGNIILHHDNINKAEENLIGVEGLSNWKGINKISDIGKLSIYEIDPLWVRSRFYGIDINDSEDVNHYIKRVFPDPSVLEDSFRNLEYRRINNAHYTLEFKDINKSFILVFNGTYDRSWKAKIGSEIIPNHIKIYGLVNGWLIQKRGDIKIEVKFNLWPWD